MIEKRAPTFVVRLYLSGPIEVAKQIIRAECLREGLCVTVEPTLFVYTGGEETGYVVGLLNYPRFPSSPDDLEARALYLMEVLLGATHQHSALMVLPHESVWITKREETAISPCKRCHGKGSVPVGTVRVLCGDCEGSGATAAPLAAPEEPRR